jgi:hypothetical protein
MPRAVEVEPQDAELLAEVHKNASEVLRIARKTLEERTVIDCRVYYQNDKGEWRPTKKGICLRPETFAAFANAAQSVVRRLDLKPEDDE